MANARRMTEVSAALTSSRLAFYATSATVIPAKARSDRPPRFVRADAGNPLPAFNAVNEQWSGRSVPVARRHRQTVLMSPDGLVPWGPMDGPGRKRQGPVAGDGSRGGSYIIVDAFRGGEPGPGPRAGFRMLEMRGESLMERGANHERRYAGKRLRPSRGGRQGCALTTEQQADTCGTARPMPASSRGSYVAMRATWNFGSLTRCRTWAARSGSSPRS